MYRSNIGRQIFAALYLEISSPINIMIVDNAHQKTLNTRISLTLDKLRKGIPESWEEQRKLFLP